MVTLILIYGRFHISFFKERRMVRESCG